MKSPEISSISAGYENLVHNNVQPLKSLSGSVISSTRDLLYHSNEMHWTPTSCSWNWTYNLRITSQADTAQTTAPCQLSDFLKLDKEYYTE